MSRDETYRQLMTEVEAILPTLEGTEKQVQWASDIRRNTVWWAVRVLDTTDRTIADLTSRGRLDVAEEHRTHRAALLSALAHLASAGWWIRMRGMLEMPENAIMTAMPREERASIDCGLWRVDREAALMTITDPR